MSIVTSILRTAESNIDQLRDPHELKLAAEDIVVAAERINARWLVPASDVAERLLGAILASEHRTVEVPKERDDLPGTVLIFDVNLASGVTVSRTAARVRRYNPDRVVAAALYALAGLQTPTSDDCHVDEIIILRESSLVPNEAEERDSRASGL